MMNINASIGRDGFAVVEGVLSSDVAAEIIAALDDSGKQTDLHARRNLLRDVRAVYALAQSSSIRGLVEPLLGPAARPVRGLFFDKTPNANWKVAWHQDLSIAVKKRVEQPGFGPWSVKQGIQHVQPPAQILQNMLTIRLHLDDCLVDNGPLLVIPGSHEHGVLTPAQIAQWRSNHKPRMCEVSRGGALLIRPLLLHASSAATNPAHRRVIHLEYSADDLPGGLEWEADEPVLTATGL
ncbi:MAG TPA: phytanoyl-CoA dioxygenase family protein [Humisphaera sp.]|nr:phytanoyl-CoA dioxygenase family protein [Humisphaera sp.]